MTSQTDWIFNPVTGTWGTTVSPGIVPPLVMVQGKQLTVNNNFTLKGIDGQIIDSSNLPQGDLALGSAALQPSSAFQPAGSISGLAATGSTSVTIATGNTPTLTIAAGLGFTVNMLVTLTDNVTPGKWIYGLVYSYNALIGALVINGLQINGSGSSTNWTVAASGTPGPTGAVSVGNLAMTGETQATSSVSTVSLSLGSVTAGDRIFVQAVARDATQTDITYLQVTQTGGSATTIVGTGNPGGSGLTAYASGHNAVVSVCGVFQVTGSGTLTLGAAETGSTGALTMSIYAFFLKGP